ncbi:hypothetical protein C8Q75DRAFT_718867 [Abortiporus biennis]|nr:hypothetical protein C8Q75DRAFT_718867 [Abortiporus biennis]
MFISPAAATFFFAIPSIPNPDQIQSADLQSCLTDNYYGNSPNGHSIFIVDSNNEKCLSSFDDSSLQEPSFIAGLLQEEGSRLLYFEREAVVFEPKERELDEYFGFLETHYFEQGFDEAEFKSGLSEDDSQIRLGEGVVGPRTPPIQHSVVEVIHQTSSRALIQIPSSLSTTYDLNLPQYWRSYLIPNAPTSLIPVPSQAVERVRTILKKLKFDPIIASIVGNISVPQMKNDVRYLTGEDPKSEILSRHSFSKGVLIAAEWLKNRIEETGATCELKKFLRGFAPNVVCTYTGSANTTETVLISAHYDSRGSFGSTRAPGGDDDGSGTTAIVAIARTIARKQITFKKNVQLVLFAGEEQGLYGSRYYSKELREKDADLLLMIQADMLAYHDPSEPAQLGLPDVIGTPEVTQLVANLSSIYSPELTVGNTPACCSDHQSFHEQGFPASQVFERAGPILDPMYHNSGDLSERYGYDLEQVKSIAKVQFATLLHSAGFDIPDDDE